MTPQENTWKLQLRGGVPGGIWSCSACGARLIESVITHEDDCAVSPSAIRAAERERIRRLSIEFGAVDDLLRAP